MEEGEKILKYYLNQTLFLGGKRLQNYKLKMLPTGE